MEQKKTKKAWKFNLIDLVILVLVAALLFGVVYLFVWRGQQSEYEGQEKIRYVLVVSAVRNEVFDNVSGMLAAGDGVYVPTSGSALGTLVSIDTKQSYASAVNAQDGSEVKSPLDGRTDVYLTIDTYVDRKTNDLTYTIDQTALALGAEIAFRTSYFTGVGTCVEIRNID